ncbi:hypothetical protein, partial [Pontiella sp.]|uniref:hypothetical protein n=1 Tax=Pontiella sp. TaxID=2837462 RepID=UPI003561662F
MIKWIFTLICTILFVLLLTNKKLEMRTVLNDYRYARKPWSKEAQIDRGREIMRPRLIPAMIELYASGRDIEFAEAMIDSSRGPKATERLWQIALADDT